MAKSAVGAGSGRSGGAGGMLFPPPAQASTVPDEWVHTNRTSLSPHNIQKMVYFFFSSEAAVWLGEEVSGTGSFWRSFLLLG